MESLSDRKCDNPTLLHEIHYLQNEIIILLLSSNKILHI